MPSRSESRAHLVIGRSRDCDLVIREQTVSARHARLSWRGTMIVVEDLGSSNGTYVDGRRIEGAAEIRPGDELRLGDVVFPWGSPKVRSFLRRGALGSTLLATSIPGRKFICGACGARGSMPSGYSGGRLRCTGCGIDLVGGPPRRGWRLVAGAAITASLTALALFVIVGLGGRSGFLDAAARLGIGDDRPAPRSNHEAAIRRHTVEKILRAVDTSEPSTRNEAVRLASEEGGPFHVAQVARIWQQARDRWSYVNDPRGGEYFAKASETIANGFAGDCDDFAIMMVAMVEAIGGEGRVVMMDGPEGGHAYAETCLHDEPESLRAEIDGYYRTHDRGAGRRVRQLHYRPGTECPVWLNLDWNAGVPGGPYVSEHWAVAIYPDGRTETLAPAGPVIAAPITPTPGRVGAPP